MEDESDIAGVSYSRTSKQSRTEKKSFSQYSSRTSDVDERNRVGSLDESATDESYSEDDRASATPVSEERGKKKGGYYMLTSSQMQLYLYGKTYWYSENQKIPEHIKRRKAEDRLQLMNNKLILPFAKRWIEALDYTRRKIFDDIDPHIVYKLVYPDCLEAFVDDHSVGEFTLIMGRIRRHEGACIMIHANSHALIDGIKCGSDITTIVTMKLETIQHVYHDYVELPHKVVDNKLVVVRDEENYFVKRISIDGEKADKKSEKIPRKQLTGYISEGACFLLHRYLLKTQRRAPICLNSLDMNLQKCSVTFAMLDEAAQLVQGTLLYTPGILQTTANLDGPSDTWITYYNRIDLHMTRRQQFGSPTEMLLVRLPVGLGRPAPDFMSDWEGNPQLWSHFIERKATIMTDYMEYLHKHDEIKALLSDFLLFLLHRKPTDICDAATYFFNDFLKDY